MSTKQSHLGKFVCWECDSTGYLIRPRNILVKKNISLLRHRPEEIVDEYASTFWENRKGSRPTYVVVFYRGKTKGPKAEGFKVKSVVETLENGGVLRDTTVQRVKLPRTQKVLHRLAVICQGMHERRQQEAK